jgi:pyruvate formate lyase activating enzyme
MTENALRFGGLQKNSYIDFPGKMSCVVFASGCNFDCPYCHNPELVSGTKNRIAESDIIEYLKQRTGWLDGVVISGGEPTLQAELPIFCEKVKSMGYPIKLDTNGSRPEMIIRLLKDGLVDYIAMDIKTDPRMYVPLIAARCNAEDILSSIDIILEGKAPYEFKTTCIKPIIGVNTMDRITQLISGASLYAIQRFVHGDVLHPEFFNGRDCHFSDGEFMELKSIAKRRVKTCIVR